MNLRESVNGQLKIQNLKLNPISFFSERPFDSDRECLRNSPARRKVAKLEMAKVSNYVGSFKKRLFSKGCLLVNDRYS